MTLDSVNEKAILDLVFWLEDLLTLARELQQELKKHYDHDEGWPHYIKRLEGMATDYGIVLRRYKDHSAWKTSNIET